MFTLTAQILDRVGIVDDDLWRPEMDTLRALAARRDEIVDQELKVPLPRGKEAPLGKNAP